MRFMIPEMTLPGPTSVDASSPFSRSVVIVFSHCTGDVSCFASVARMLSASPCGSTSTLDMTGIYGADIGVSFRPAVRASAAGAM